MYEKYNKYSESLYIGKNKVQTNQNTTQTSNCSCEGLIEKDNTTDILIQQLKKEVKDLMQTTQAKLLCQDKKIAQLENYIKTNLSNYLRVLFDSMVQSGEIEQIIKDIIGEINSTQLEEIENIKTDLSKVTSDLEIAKNDISMNIDNIRDNQSAIEEIKENQIDFENQVSRIGLSFNDYNLTSESTYEDINYTNIEYNRNNGCADDYEVTSNGIYIKNKYKKNLLVNLSTNVRPDSGTGGLKYFRIELWRNDTMIESQLTATEVTNNGRANLSISCYFKVTYNDIIKIKGYGKPQDTFLLTRINMELSKQDNINYYTD